MAAVASNQTRRHRKGVQLAAVLRMRHSRTLRLSQPDQGGLDLILQVSERTLEISVASLVPYLFSAVCRC